MTVLFAKPTTKNLFIFKLFGRLYETKDHIRGERTLLLGGSGGLEALQSKGCSWGFQATTGSFKRFQKHSRDVIGFSGNSKNIL